MKDKKIAIIGCGNLGMSILNGLLNIENIQENNITVTKRNIQSIAYLTNTKINITTNNIEAIQQSELLIIALKPYNILEVLKELQPFIEEGKHTIVSLATGISLDELEQTVKAKIPLFRAMPNTAADVSMSLTCICTNTNNDEAKQLVKQCFDSVGNTITINEKLMDAATILGACGIAYALRFIRAMIQGGIQIGFDSKTATEIVTHTVQGASELLIKRKQHPESEIDKVTTPKGCTITGLNEMEHNGFSSALIKGIISSFDAIE